jgi:glutamate dehydrogenase
MNHLLRFNVSETVTDLFIPAGGRPRTLHEGNYTEFLDDRGKPTSKAIVEGANLYLTPEARERLEERGCLIIKDSSANKTGVICSSFEVLAGLTLGDEKFLEYKEQLVKEILTRLEECASNEANLLIRTHQETGEPLTKISDIISRHINDFTYQILDHLDTITLSDKPNDPLVNCFLSYCLPTLRNNFQKELLKEIPEHHKKAIIACHLAARIVYRKGLKWHPSIVDILPIILEEERLLGVE